MLELHVSGAGVTSAAVAALLLRLGVEASVVPTLNVSRPDEKSEAPQIEDGVVIIFPSCERRQFSEEVWPEMKRTFGLRCGWVDATSRGFRGCTENFCRPSSCPYAVASGAPSRPCHGADAGAPVPDDF
jgi:hypothetical protein